MLCSFRSLYPRNTPEQVMSSKQQITSQNTGSETNHETVIQTFGGSDAFAMGKTTRLRFAATQSTSNHTADQSILNPKTDIKKNNQPIASLRQYTKRALSSLTSRYEHVLDYRFIDINRPRLASSPSLDVVLTACSSFHCCVHRLYCRLVQPASLS